MSNIPSSAMPHAGGQKEFSGNDTGSVQAAGTDTDSASFGSNRGSQQSGSFAATGSTGSSGTYQPDTYRRETFYSDRSRENKGGLMEKAREHKTGIAVGVAVGAIAAAAIPFMFSKKKSSSERDFSAQYDRDLYVDNRSTAGSGSSSAMSGTTTIGTSGTAGAGGSTTTTGTGGTSGGRF